MFSPELRSSLYTLFSDYFNFPDQASNPLLDQEVLAEAASLLGVEGPPRSRIGTILELQTAYTGLFINRPGGVRAHLYGSVYLENEPRLMGESTRAVLDAYQQAGVNPEGFSEPCDFLPIVLEFMAHLADEECQSLKTGDREAVEELQRRQVSFWKNSLQPWIFEFCRRVTDDEMAHPLYHWGAQLLECFCRMEKRHLGR